MRSLFLLFSIFLLTVFGVSLTTAISPVADFSSAFSETAALSSTVNTSLIDSAPLASVVRVIGLNHTTETIGTGFAVSPDGLIVTNAHVINQPDMQYSVTTYDGNNYPAQVINYDYRYDLALLHTDAPLSAWLPLAAAADISSLTHQGITVIGSTPTGSSLVTKPGRVTGSAYAVTPYAVMDTPVMKLSSHITQGNSGGPVINTNGEVIGIVFALSDADADVGYAIPVSALYHMIENQTPNTLVSRLFPAN